MGRVSQLSFFSADVAEPQLDDLGGVLAAHGQITLGTTGTDARLSVLLHASWRAAALTAEFAARGVPAGVSGNPDSGILLRSERDAALVPLARAWTKGAVKDVPPLRTGAGGLLRCWALAAGRTDDTGYLLGLDPRSPQTHARLASALAAAGIAGVLLGVRGGGPAVRIVGRRRMDRLSELIGAPPPGAPADAFPRQR